MFPKNLLHCSINNKTLPFFCIGIPVNPRPKNPYGMGVTVVMDF